MSTDYSHDVISAGNTTLKVNFTGITDGQTDRDTLGMAIYAFDNSSGKTVFTEQLNFDEIRAFYHHLHQISTIRDSSAPGSGKIIEASEKIADLVEKLKSLDENILQSVLDTFESNEKVLTLLKALSETELHSLSAAHKYQAYKREYENLKELLELEHNGNIVADIKSHDNLADYAAGQPEKIFQNWIENNLWVFGVDYTKKHDVSKIAFDSDSDILVESLDGFLDLIEMKRPKDFEIFKEDASHNCYYPAPPLAKALGQSFFYLQQLDDFKLNIEKKYKVKVLRPRIKIVGGRSANFNDAQNHALRMLNSNIVSVQVYSFDYILSAAETVIKGLEN